MKLNLFNGQKQWLKMNSKKLDLRSSTISKHSIRIPGSLDPFSKYSPVQFGTPRAKIRRSAV